MTKKRYVFMDCVRGFAAIFVVMRHTAGYWGFDFDHSYLAVDIFFLLSGFVIGYAYDARIQSGEMDSKNFIFSRLIRLYPLYIISLLLSFPVLEKYFTFTSVVNGFSHYNLREIAEATSVFVMTAAFLPTHVNGSEMLFSLNAPYWSLFFEIVVNIIYVLVAKKLTNTINVLIILVSGAGLVYISHVSGNLDIGYSWSLISLAAGAARSVFGFFVGYYIYKNLGLFENILKFKYSRWISLFVMLTIFAVPSSEAFNKIFDPLVVIVLFPILMVAFTKHDATDSGFKILDLVGFVSYPLYVLHIPLTRLPRLFMPDEMTTYAPFSGLILMAAMLVISYLLTKYYDIPVRRYLNHKFVRARKLA